MAKLIIILSLAFLSLLIGLLTGFDTIRNQDHYTIKDILIRMMLSVTLLSLTSITVIFIIASLGVAQ